MTDADYIDDIVLLESIHTQANALEHAVGGIGHHVNANKTE